MSTGQRAATKRTILMLLRPLWFTQALTVEIQRAEKKALRTSIPALFRLNGTSDLDFSEVIRANPLSSFYDYTKVLSRVRKNTLPNYHLTYSGSMFSVASKLALGKAIEARYNTVVAFNTKGLTGESVALGDAMAGLYNMDNTDLRPLDPKGALGALKRKGSSRATRATEGYSSFFVTSENLSEFTQIIAKG
jgi:hypothetical protein